jgi:NDP-sugar pyrophosphorylase family protein
MSEWITDRLPMVEDALHYCVLLWDEDDGVLVWSYDAVNEGQPWMPIPKPDMYVKPKRWAAKWDETNGKWNIANKDGLIVAILRLDVDARTTAQRIADIYNEVMP